MRITIVLAILVFSAIILASHCDFVYAAEPVVEKLTNVDPGAVEIGSSLIGPASPIYFLKTIREKIELKLSSSAQSIVLRQLEFAHRRLRETNNLVKNKRQDLIQVTMERYRQHFNLANQKAVGDKDLQMKVAEAVARNLDVLIRVYDQVGDPSAKREIRASTIFSEKLSRQILDGLDLANQQLLIGKVAKRQAAACKFLSREASGSGLTDSELEILRNNVKDCESNVTTNLKDQLETRP